MRLCMGISIENTSEKRFLVFSVWNFIFQSPNLAACCQVKFAYASGTDNIHSSSLYKQLTSRKA